MPPPGMASQLTNLPTIDTPTLTMSTLLSLFDASGNWASEFFHNRWDVHTFDLSNGQDILQFESYGQILEEFCDVDGVLAAIPCDDFSLSGARWWQVKDKNGSTAASVELVYQTLRFIELFKPTDPDYFQEGGTFFWAIENPVGRISNLVPELGTSYYFDPCEFAGFLNLSDTDHNELDRLRRKDGKNFCSEERNFVIECNAYNKKTGLWGEFNRNLKKSPVEPVRCNRYGSPFMSLGGKSAKTKSQRSVTPLGFSKSFYEANKQYVIHECPDQLTLFG